MLMYVHCILPIANCPLFFAFCPLHSRRINSKCRDYRCAMNWTLLLHFSLHTGNCQLRTANCELPTADCVLPIVFPVLQVALPKCLLCFPMHHF